MRYVRFALVASALLLSVAFSPIPQTEAFASVTQASSSLIFTMFFMVFGMVLIMSILMMFLFIILIFLFFPFFLCLSFAILPFVFPLIVIDIIYQFMDEMSAFFFDSLYRLRSPSYTLEVEIRPGSYPYP